MKKRRSPRQRKDFLTKKLLQFIPLLGLVSFLVFTYLAINAYDNYVFLEQTLSELGVGPSAIYFNTGVILAGIFLIPFYALRFSKSTLSKIGSATGTISALALIFVGIFPLTVVIPHFVSAFLFFFLSAIAIFVFSFDDYFTGKKDIICINEVIIALIILLHILVFRNPFMQKLAVILIIMWALFTLMEDGILEFQLRLKNHS